MSTAERFVDRYRPNTLRELVGQDKASASLQGLIDKGKVAGNTILLSGPYGVGKTSIARILARTVNCSSTEEIKPCGTCSSCKVPTSSHPDIKEINVADSRGIDDVRQMLDVAKLRPRHKARVFIMDEFHQLTGPAAQAFLKILEEPPKSTSFILCTTDPYKLLPTIRSRSSWIKLAEIPLRDTARLLHRVCKAEGLNFPKEVLTFIAEMSSGHARDALNMLEQLGSAAPSMTIEEAKERLPEIAEGILGASPDALVPKYVHKLLDGTIIPMVYLRKVDNVEYLISLILKFLKEMTIFYIEPKMVDNASMASFAKTDFKNKSKITPGLLTSLYEIHLDAQERVKSRSIDPLDAMDLAILKSVKLLGA